MKTFGKRKCIAAVLVLLLAMSIAPMVSLAENRIFVNGETFDLSACTAGDTVTIAEGTSVTLTGNCTNVRIICGPNATLTLQNVTIANTTIGYSPLTFTGEGSQLIVTGDNTLTGARNAAAVLTTDAAVTISGEGKLTANGGHNGSFGCAGIGGNASGNGGNIIIESGTIVANGGGHNKGYSDYAGIAGAVTISGGTVTAIGDSSGSGIADASRTGTIVTIKGGNVTACSNVDAVGIGSYGVRGGSGVVISGGNVTAYCLGGSGTGIGGPSGGTADVITITGGTVTATGGYARPGISGYVTISGGTIYARGNTGSNDLGDTSLTITDSAAIFLCNDRIGALTTEHTHLTYTEDTESVYGFAIPSDWTPSFGAYLHFVTLSCDANGGSGAVPDPATQLYGTTVTVWDGSALTRENYNFSGWNTAADGSGTSFAMGETFTFTNNTTLHAQWVAQPSLSPSVENSSIYTGGRISLTPNIPGGTWSFDNAFLTRDGNTFTALKTGTSIVTYTVEGQSVYYTVIIKKAQLPSTGQNFVWAIMLSGLALAVLFAAVTEGKCKARS